MPPDHVLGDRGLAEVISELQQLAMDTRRTPEWVFKRYPADHRSHLDRNLGSASSRIAPPTPVKPPTGSVPTNDGVGLDDGQVAAPVWEKAGEESPKRSIRRLQEWPLRVALENLKLMAQCDVLEG